MGTYDTTLTRNGVSYTPTSANAPDANKNTLERVFEINLPGLVAKSEDADAAMKAMADDASSMLGALNAGKAQKIMSASFSAVQGFLESDSKITKDLTQSLGQS